MKSEFRFLKTEQNQYYIILPSISNETEYYFFYANLSQVDVEENQEVSAGGVIGQTGQSGNANGQSARMAHLHFEVRNSATRGSGNRIILR
tara:strand:- start:80886 stop:81158 length:273 start_codon:yes stop_codon:yes gene_type:complete